jgi:hypothetical protein
MGAEPTIEGGSEAMGAVALRIIDGGTLDMPLALDLPAGLTFTQWEAEGRRLSFSSHALQWFIGDWWNAGERFGEEQRAETAKRLFGLEYGTVRNYGSVAGRVPVSLRSDIVPFSHYREVASLPAETAQDLINRAVEQSLTVQALRREVQALKATNDTVTAPSEPIQRAAPKPERTDLEEAYARIIEFADAIEHFRPLDRREADFVAKALDHLGEAHAERRPVPDDFDVVFVEQGRVACENWYRASRITVNRWLIQRGKRRLIDERANFVKHQRTIAHQPKPAGQPVSNEIDTYLPVARMAADFLRIRRNGGWMISIHECGGWRVGTVQRTSEQLIAMAVNSGFDRDAAVAEARAEGY